MKKINSNKVGIRAAGGIRDNYFIDSKVSYYDGEDIYDNE